MCSPQNSRRLSQADTRQQQEGEASYINMKMILVKTQKNCPGGV